MNEETLKKIGLKQSDFDEELKPESELIASVTTSGRLYRKAIQYIILKDLRIYFNDPELNDPGDISKHFKYWKRKKSWADFRNRMVFKTPELRVENFAILLMVTYLLVYGYYVFKLVSKNIDFLMHVSLSGMSIAGLIFAGVVVPLIIIFHLGKTELPAKTVEGLVDKIIQESMHDLLTEDRKNSKQIQKRIKFGLSGQRATQLFFLALLFPQRLSFKFIHRILVSINQ